MSVLRKRVKHYGKLPSSTIRDERLTDRSLGLLLRIVDLPDNWIVRADTLAAGRPQGRDATAGALRNLAACGYYRVERRKMRNGRFQMGTAISEDSVPQWEAEYAEFEGKPIPLIEQSDGTFKVRRKDGTTTDDGFVGDYAPGANDLPMPGEIPGQAGNGKSGSGKEDDQAWSLEPDITGHGFLGSGNPASGGGGSFSTTEKYSRDVEKPAGLLAVGELTAATRGGPAPAANDQDQLSRESWRTATVLPRRYRDGLPSELRFPMVHEIRGALAEGFEPAAVLRYAELCATNTAYAADKHLPLLRAAVRLLRQDARMGLVCPACGNEPGDPFGAPCHRCRPDREHLDADDLAQLEAARRFLEGDHLDDAQGPYTPPQAAQGHSGAQSAPDEPAAPYSEAYGDLRGACDQSDSGGGGNDQDGGADQASEPPAAR